MDRQQIIALGRVGLKSWFAWCCYLAIGIALAQYISVWFIRWPLIILCVFLYIVFSGIQIGKLLISGIPIYFATVSTRSQRAQVFKDAIAGYFMTIFEFAIFYLLISIDDEKAFNVGTLDLGSALYFSVVTMATVGYGDILPVDPTTRMFVCFEILIGLGFTVLLFSMLANLRVDSEERRTQ